MNVEPTFTLALAGNPNVGKSTIFNALTNLRQHTGNWAGKTVACASGIFTYRDAQCLVVDLPGIYSLRTHSEEEEIAREYLCSEEADLLLVVGDATCLERGLHLLKQIANLEDTKLPSIILCVNLCDEAAKKGIILDFNLLSERLNIPVIPCAARNKDGLDKLKEQIYSAYQAHMKNQNLNPEHSSAQSPAIQPKKHYSGDSFTTPPLHSVEETAAGFFCHGCAGCPFSCMETNASAQEQSEAMPGQDNLMQELNNTLQVPNNALQETNNTLQEPNNALQETNNGSRKQHNSAQKREAGFSLTTCSVNIPDFSPKELAALAVSYTNPSYRRREEILDRVLTGRFTGSLIMILLLLGIFWLTITGANYPSEFLWNCFYRMETWLAALLTSAGAPAWFISASVYGVFRVVAWIVSVMLPPMAIFFPLFTLLEDLGYLPRVAFNMDCAFKRCKACGKQCLTMCIVIAASTSTRFRRVFNTSPSTCRTDSF